MHRKGAGWRFLSPVEARDEHVAHRLDPTKTFLDDVIAHFQHEETRRAFAAAERRPELEKRSSFLKWVRELRRADEEAERRAIETEMRREENDRLWSPFRNSPDSSADE